MMKLTNRVEFLAGMGAAAAAVALPRVARAQTASGLTTLRLGTAGNDDAAPIVWGQKNGIFAKYGLDIQINKNPGPAAAALIGGSYDLGKSAVTSMLQAHENNIPLNLIAAASVENVKVPYAAFLMSKDTPLHSGKDLEGQIVGLVVLGGIGQVAMMKWATQHGGDPKLIKFVEVPTYAAAGAIQQGRVFASECTYPAIGAALESGKMTTATLYEVLGNNTVLTAWAVTQDFSSKHPDLIKAFARAWKESSIYTNAHHADTVDMMAEFTGIQSSVIAAMPRATASPTLVAGQVQPMIDDCAKFGVLKAPFPAGDILDPNIRV
jgi:ABC-type nitrate/sulfonate/bicarbonate transport system substrate-binding protein